MATFDIFEGEAGPEAVWIASAEGMQNAKVTMVRIASKRPGKYFVWESYSKQVLAIADTTLKQSAANL